MKHTAKEIRVALASVLRRTEIVRIRAGVHLDDWVRWGESAIRCRPVDL